MLKMSAAVRRYSLGRKALTRMLNDGLIDGDRTPGGKKRDGHWRTNRESADEYFQRSDKKAVAIVRSLGL